MWGRYYSFDMMAQGEEVDDFITSKLLLFKDCRIICFHATAYNNFKQKCPMFNIMFEIFLHNLLEL